MVFDSSPWISDGFLIFDASLDDANNQNHGHRLRRQIGTMAGGGVPRCLARCLSRSLAASLAAYALARARAGCVLQQLQL